MCGLEKGLLVSGQSEACTCMKIPPEINTHLPLYFLLDFDHIMRTNGPLLIVFYFGTISGHKVIQLFCWPAMSPVFCYCYVFGTEEVH